MTNCCINCVFSSPGQFSDEGELECRRRAPTIIGIPDLRLMPPVITGHRTVYPPVDPGNWCGEYESINATSNMNHPHIRE